MPLGFLHYFHLHVPQPSNHLSLERWNDKGFTSLTGRLNFFLRVVGGVGGDIPKDNKQK
jgi:hypothetical protein